MQIKELSFFIEPARKQHCHGTSNAITFLSHLCRLNYTISLSTLALDFLFFFSSWNSILWKKMLYINNFICVIQSIVHQRKFIAWTIFRFHPEINNDLFLSLWSSGVKCQLVIARRNMNSTKFNNSCECFSL